MKVIKGTLHLFSETGTEGGWWSIQDENFIFKDDKMPGGVSWSYEGLHSLSTRDYLKIFNPDGSIYWEGEIKLKMYPLFTEHASGLWIHADQEGISREEWSIPFFEEYEGELTKADK